MTVDEAAYFMVYAREVIMLHKTDIAETVAALMRAETKLIKDMVPDELPPDADAEQTHEWQVAWADFARDNYIVPIKTPYSGVGKATVKTYGVPKPVAGSGPSVAPSPSKAPPAKKARGAR